MQISWTTVALVAVVVVGIVVASWLKAPPEALGAIGAVGTVVAGLLRSAVTKPAEEPKP